MSKEIQQEVDNLTAENVKLKQDIKHLHNQGGLLFKRIERLEVQLAGCGVAAMQNTNESIKERISKDSYGWSASYQDVCNAIDREVTLRKQIDCLTAERIKIE